MTRSRSVNDERAPLLGNGKPLPPFPTRQMFVLAICRICEPIAFMGIFPYVYYMIKDFGITQDENKISFYAGMVTSAFTFAEFSSGLFWGWMSGKVGRKPVLMTGLAGTALSVLVFGFAPNLTIALIARALGGLLNGNMGVLQTTVAELVRVKEHQPRAYTIMPLVWCLGSIIGPTIGGALARPCISYPALFSKDTIWDRFPYLLPNLFSAVVVMVGLVNGILFLEETHPGLKGRRDLGLELGNWILSKFSASYQHPSGKDTVLKGFENESLLIHDEPLPPYRSADSSPTNSPRLRPVAPANEPTGGQTLIPGTVSIPAEESNKTFTRPVILNIVSFGILAFHTMVFDSILPIFLSTAPPTHPIKPELPFKFVDGFGLDTKTIGVILSGQGFYSMILNLVVVPIVVKRLGALRLFKLLAISYFALYLIAPYLVLLPDNLRMIGIALILMWKCAFANMAYPSNAMLIANSAPSNQVALGVINGVAASTASLCRAFGPTISGMLYSLGLQTGYSGLAWWSTAAMTVIGAYVAIQIPETKGRLDEKSPTDVEARLTTEAPVEATR